MLAIISIVQQDDRKPEFQIKWIYAKFEIKRFHNSKYKQYFKSAITLSRHSNTQMTALAHLKRLGTLR